MNDLFSARSKGGIARRESLSQEARTAIAKRAASARWGVKATHRGNFQDHFGVDVDCYVLDDEQKTAVISQTGMARALGLNNSGSAFPRFLATKAMTDTVGADLREKLENPLKFHWGTGGAESPPPSVIYGFDATLLIDVCKAIIAAEAAGMLRRQKAAMQAHIILGPSAKNGIKGLVYALAGYSPTIEEVIAAFKLYVLEEAKKYEPEFPNELYMQWHRLYDLAVPDRGKPWQFKYLTVNHVYYPLAKSNGKLLALLRAVKSRGGDRQKKLFQFLNDIGARALRIQLGRILEMAESSLDRFTYEQKVRARFGEQLELELIAPNAPSVSVPPS
jgi:P63C domain